MSEDEPQALRERVAALEDRLDELTSREAGTTDQQGRQWGPTDLMQLGLSRRQAIVAFGMLAGGAALPTALRSAVETAAASDGSAVGDVGSSTNRVNVYAHVLNADDVNSDVGDGATRELLRVDSATAGAFGAFFSQHTPDVSTSAKTIWEAYGSEIEGATIQVAGRDTSNFETFYDTIQYGRFVGVTVTDTQASNDASTRSYSINSNKELQLSMSADTYQVTVTGIAASTPS